MTELDPTLRLRRTCASIKERFLKMYHEANAGHVGSSLSCAEILTFIRFGWMQEGCELILSKGHAAAALYATLAEAGDMDSELLSTFYKEGTYLSAHPPPNKLPGIPFATGSLGHGLSLAAGVALALKLQQKPGFVFCVTSDGELNEGSIWEAALFASQHGLTNLFWLIDRNRLQGFGKTEEVMALEPLHEKLHAFGCLVTEADGHSFPALLKAKNNLLSNRAHRGARAIICHTVKGRGLGTLADTVDCHYLPMDANRYAEINRSLQEEDGTNA